MSWFLTHPKEVRRPFLYVVRKHAPDCLNDSYGCIAGCETDSELRERIKRVASEGEK